YSLFGQADKREDKIRQSRILRVKEVNVEVEPVTNTNSASIQVRGAEHEGPRPICDAAGSLAVDRLRFKHERVWAVAADVASACGVARRHAYQFSEDAAKRAPDDVARFMGREIDGPRGAEMKSKSEEFEGQRDRIALRYRTSRPAGRQAPGRSL